MSEFFKKITQFLLLIKFFFISSEAEDDDDDENDEEMEVTEGNSSTINTVNNIPVRANGDDDDEFNFADYDDESMKDNSN